jgi:hypothetical protein
LIRISKSQVHIDSVINSPELADMFSEIDESERDDTLEKLLYAALAARRAISTDLETATIEKSVSRAVSKLNEHFLEVQNEISQQIEILTDPEKGKVQELLNTVLTSGFESLLDPSDEKTPLGRLNTEIESQLKSLGNLFVPINQKLGIKLAGTESDTNTKGNDFENLVVSKFEEYGQLFHDTIVRTGDSIETGTRSKKGDLVVKLLNSSSRLEETKFVVEAKTAQGFKLLNRLKSPNLANEKEILGNIREIAKFRGAQVGIFILDEEHLNMEQQLRWKFLDDNFLLLVLDTFTPQSDYIQLAYVWARWRLNILDTESRSEIAVKQQTMDTKVFLELLNDLISDLNTKVGLEQAFSNARSGLEAARTAALERNSKLQEKVQRLLDLVNF